MGRRQSGVLHLHSKHQNARVFPCWFYHVVVFHNFHYFCGSCSGLCTVMKRGTRAQILMCISQPRSLTKRCRWKESLCSGTSSQMCLVAAGLHPLLRLVPYIYLKTGIAFLIKTFITSFFFFFIMQETEPKLSPSWNPKIICEPHPQFTEPLSATTPFEAVQVGSLSGKIELSLTLKNNLALPGAKVNIIFWKQNIIWNIIFGCYRHFACAASQLDIVGHIDALLVLLSPRQVHLLLDMLGAFSGGREHLEFFLHKTHDPQTGFQRH